MVLVCRLSTLRTNLFPISLFFLSFFFIISFLFLKFTSSNYSENNCPTTMHSFHSRPSSEFSGLFDIRFRLEIKWCLCQRVSFGEWVIFFLLQFKRARACNRSGKKGSSAKKEGTVRARLRSIRGQRSNNRVQVRWQSPIMNPARHCRQCSGLKYSGRVV